MVLGTIRSLATLRTTVAPPVSSVASTLTV